jgi:hypothetical protein
MKIESLLILLACNFRARAATNDVATGQPLIIYRGNRARLRCAIFGGDPTVSTNLVTDWTDTVSASLVVRSGNAQGTVLISKTVLVANFDTGLTYSEWLAGDGHFDFVLTGTDTNQTVPSNGKLDIYWAIELNTTDTDPITLAYGTGAIQEDGIGNAGAPTPGDPNYFTAAESDARFIPLSGKASEAEAEAGTVNDKWMTPLRTAQAIAALRPDTHVALKSPDETLWHITVNNAGALVVTAQ